MLFAFIVTVFLRRGHFNYRIFYQSSDKRVDDCLFILRFSEATDDGDDLLR